MVQPISAITPCGPRQIAAATMAAAGVLLALTACGGSDSDGGEKKEEASAPSLAEAVESVNSTLDAVDAFTLTFNATFDKNESSYVLTFADFDNPKGAFFAELREKDLTGEKPESVVDYLMVEGKSWTRPSPAVWEMIYKDTPEDVTPELVEQFIEDRDQGKQAGIIREAVTDLATNSLKVLQLEEDPNSAEPEVVGKAEEYEGRDVYTYDDGTFIVRITQEAPHRFVSMEQRATDPTSDHVALIELSAEGDLEGQVTAPTKTQVVDLLSEVQYRIMRVNSAVGGLLSGL